MTVRYHYIAGVEPFLCLCLLHIGPVQDFLLMYRHVRFFLIANTVILVCLLYGFHFAAQETQAAGEKKESRATRM